MTWIPFLLLMLLVAGCTVPIAADDARPTLIIRDDPLPVIAVAPRLGGPGTTVFVSGAGWQPDSAVFVNLTTETEDGESLDVTVAASSVAADTRFSASFVYPYDPPWSELDLVTIVAYTTDTGDEASAVFGVVPETETSGTPTVTITPTITQTITPTPTPAGSSAAGPSSSTATVISTGLNVRSGPSTAYPVIRQLTRGDTMLVLGQSADSYWLYVQLQDGLIGWVARNYTDFRGTVAVVRPGAPPPNVIAPPTPKPMPPMASRWVGEYFNNVNLSGQPALVRNDYNLNFNWGYGSPDQRIQTNYFSARWTQPVYFPGGTVRFFAETDDGVRIYVDDVLVVDSWRAATGGILTGDVPISRGTHVVRVEYFELTQIAKIKVWWARVDGVTFPEWRGEYYANKDLYGPPSLVRNDAAIDFNWGNGSPAPNIPNDDFSVRWSRTVYFESDRYRFNARMDDGMRVYLDGSLIIDSWRDGSARTLSTDRDVSAGNHHIVVEYYEHLQQAEAKFWWEMVGSSSPDSFPDWKGEYWSNRQLSGSPTVTRNDRRIDFNWGTGSPDSRIPNDNFSARWTRKYNFDDGWYRINARSDDGVRVWVDDKRIIDEWHDSVGDVTYSYDIYLDGNTKLKVEYYERYGGAAIKVWWDRIDGPSTTTPTPTRTLTPTPEATRSPYARLSPDSGQPGASVSISGGGFPANATVNILLASPVRSRSASDAGVYASTTADSNGNYSTSVTIPTTWPDGSTIEPGELLVIAATPNYSVSASAVFEVKAPRPTVSADPYAELQPSSGGPNTNVRISGGGFPANTGISVYLGGVVSAASRSSSPTVYATGSSDGNGNYAITFAMPNTWADGSEVSTGTINVMAATSGFGVSASSLFNYFRDAPNPSVSLSPSSGGAGTVVIVNGEGYPGNTGVNIYLGTFDGSVGSGDPFLYGTTRTIDSGAFSTVINMPAVWPDGSTVSSNQLVVWARTDDSKVQASSIFSYRGSSSPTTPTVTPTATDLPAAGATATPNPYARISPGGGSGGTQVIVTGGGFPANVTVSAMLALFDKSGGNGDAARYATTSTNATGDYSMSFIMPSTLPNGQPAPSGPAMVVVATDDLRVSASVTFDYAGVTAAVEKPTLTPTPTRTPLPTEPVPPTEIPAETATEPLNTPAPTITIEAETTTPEPPTETPNADAALESPTDTPEPATAEPPTATPEPSDEAPDADASLESSNEEVTPPTAVPTPTPEPPTATTEPPTATPEPLPPTAEPPTATPEPLPPTAEPPTATPEPPPPTAEPPTATLEPPPPTAEPPTATPEPPPPTAEPPTATPEPLPPTAEPPTAVPTPTPEPEPEAASAVEASLD